MPAQAVIVPVGERPEIWRLFRAKYGLELPAIVAAERLLGCCGWGARRHGERIYLELAVTTARQETVSAGSVSGRART